MGVGAGVTCGYRARRGSRSTQAGMVLERGDVGFGARGTSPAIHSTNQIVMHQLSLQPLSPTRVGQIPCPQTPISGRMKAT